jgi:serine/threonine protein kinase
VAAVVTCPKCHGEVLEIDVKCPHCGHAVGATGAHRMLGQVVLGTYELVDVLGQGGMSVVFKAKHKMTEQEVALKILPPELAAHSQVKSRFLEEAKALAALDHPNIVHLYNFGQENSSFVLAMQYVQGQTWERLILENKRLDWKISCRIAIDVLKALEYAHGRGVVHRDMKPSNVLVRADDSSATVMDFGIAKMTTSTRLTATGQTMGTVRYMSPEQVRGQDVDLRTDIYSLGATLYESVVGDTPFEGETHFEIMTKHLSEPPKRPSAHGVDMPAQIEDALMRALSKRAEDRFPDAREMRKIIESALKEADIGLVETQRIGRELLAGIPSAALSKPAAAARSASAAALADELEPGTSSARTPRRRTPRWPWIVIAVSALALAGVGTAILVKRGKHGYEAVTKIPGVTITGGKAIGDLRIETDGPVTPEEIGAAYTAALDELQQFDPKVKARLRVIDTIVAIPASHLCDPGILHVSLEPCDAARTLAVSAIGAGKSHVLLISDQKDVLAGTVRAGLAQAVCDFQIDYLAKTQEGLALLDQVCAMTQRFRGAHD